MLPMLASDAPEDRRELEFPLLASVKYDGVRAVVRGGKLLAARSGKIIPNKWLQDAYGGAGMEGFEGELVLGGQRPFSETQSLVMSKDAPVPDCGVYFMVFDLQDPKLNYLDRIFEAGRTRIPCLPHGCFTEVVIHRNIQDVEELAAFYESEVLLGGQEGLMLRWPQDAYTEGRSKRVLKMKPIGSAEGVLRTILPERTNTNEKVTDPNGRTKRTSHKGGMGTKNRAGTLILRGLGKFHGKEIALGSGLTDALSTEIWYNPEQYIGKIVTFKHKGLTTTGLPRFPVFQHFRDDKDMP